MIPSTKTLCCTAAFREELLLYTTFTLPLTVHKINHITYPSLVCRVHSVQLVPQTRITRGNSGNNIGLPSNEQCTTVRGQDPDRLVLHSFRMRVVSFHSTSPHVPDPQVLPSPRYNTII